MITHSKKSRFNGLFRGISLVVLSAFITTGLIPAPRGYAQDLNLPIPGTMVNLSSSFEPAMIQGIKISPDNPLLFNFLIDPGQVPLSQAQKRSEYHRLITYFLAALTTPEKDMWVNLSPYEHGRIVSLNFGHTEMGRDMLAQDYILKQLSASLVYPEAGLGRKFWDSVYEKIREQNGGITEVPVNTFNKVWIVPDTATVFEKGNVAIITQSHLKVLMEEDYLSLNKHDNAIKMGLSDANSLPNNSHQISSQVMRQIIIPAVEQEINEGKNFAKLRQMYNSMILAAWFKKTMKMHMLSEIYVNKNKNKGVELKNPQDNEMIYQRYLKAYKKGVYNYIKEETDPSSGALIPRKYFSGGFAGQAMISKVETTHSAAMLGGLVKKISDLVPVNLTAITTAGILLAAASVQAGTVGHGLGLSKNYTAPPVPEWMHYHPGNAPGNVLHGGQLQIMGNHLAAPVVNTSTNLTPAAPIVPVTSTNLPSVGLDYHPGMHPGNIEHGGELQIQAHAPTHTPAPTTAPTAGTPLSPIVIHGISPTNNVSPVIDAINAQVLSAIGDYNDSISDPNNELDVTPTQNIHVQKAVDSYAAKLTKLKNRDISEGKVVDSGTSLINLVDNTIFPPTAAPTTTAPGINTKFSWYHPGRDFGDLIGLGFGAITPNSWGVAVTDATHPIQYGGHEVKLAFQSSQGVTFVDGQGNTNTIPVGATVVEHNSTNSYTLYNVNPSFYHGTNNVQFYYSTAPNGLRVNATIVATTNIDSVTPVLTSTNLAPIDISGIGTTNASPIITEINNEVLTALGTFNAYIADPTNHVSNSKYKKVKSLTGGYVGLLGDLERGRASEGDVVDAGKDLTGAITKIITAPPAVTTTPPTTAAPAHAPKSVVVNLDTVANNFVAGSTLVLTNGTHYKRTLSVAPDQTNTNFYLINQEGGNWIMRNNPFTVPEITTHRVAAADMVGATEILPGFFGSSALGYKDYFNGIDRRVPGYENPTNTPDVSIGDMIGTVLNGKTTVVGRVATLVLMRPGPGDNVRDFRYFAVVMNDVTSESSYVDLNPNPDAKSYGYTILPPGTPVTSPQALSGVTNLAPIGISGISTNTASQVINDINGQVTVALGDFNNLLQGGKISKSQYKKAVQLKSRYENRLKDHGRKRATEGEVVDAGNKFVAFVRDLTTVGGIDFDSKYLQMNIQGDGINIPVPQGFQWLLHTSISGFIPKILDIRSGVGFDLAFFKGMLSPQEQQEAQGNLPATSAVFHDQMAMKEWAREEKPVV